MDVVHGMVHACMGGGVDDVNCELSQTGAPSIDWTNLETESSYLLQSKSGVKSQDLQTISQLIIRVDGLITIAFNNEFMFTTFQAGLTIELPKCSHHKFYIALPLLDLKC